jgi:hypothetical protein
MNSSMDKLKEQKWEEFNNSDFIIQEELKKMRGSNLNSFCDSLNTSAEYARIAGASSFSSGTSNGAEESCEYNLSLKVTYKTNWGQEIGVVGNIPQLGNWDVKKALKMSWTNGHVWTAHNIKVDEARGDKTYFMYKYVVINNGNHKTFERGLDRIADLKLLNSETGHNNYI